MSSLTKMEKRYEELLDKLSEEQKKLGKIDNKIMKQERLNIKEIAPKIVDETKALEEKKKKIKKIRDKNKEKLLLE